MPATSQLDWLISITAITVLSGSRRVRHRLRSFNFCMGRSIDSHQRRWIQHPRRYPIASLLVGLSPAGMAASLAAPDPYGPNSGIRLPPRVSDGEARSGPRMEDTGCGEPVVHQRLHPLKSRRVLVAASRERTPPQIADMMAEC